MSQTQDVENVHISDCCRLFTSQNLVANWQSKRNKNNNENIEINKYNRNDSFTLKDAQGTNHSFDAMKKNHRKKRTNLFQKRFFIH